jgi:uncharacterized membrane protein
MITWLKRIFYTSIFGRIYFEFLLWLDRRAEKAETKQLINTIIAEINITKEKYDKSITNLKTKIKDEATDGDYDKVLKSKENLISLTENEEEHLKKRAELLKSVMVKRGDKDINNNTEMARMVDSRINDYRTLHRDINMRQLLREIRKAEKEGNSQLAESLKVELKEKYGRF